MRRDLRDLPVGELAGVAEAAGLKAYGARQLYDWLYRQGATSFEAMTNLSATVRARLAEAYDLRTMVPSTTQEARDGTTKLLFRLDTSRPPQAVSEHREREGEAPPALPVEGATRAPQIETVVIPANRRDHSPRRTLCISTQAGCAMGCTFCHTGTMGLVRQLTQGEILGQILAARAMLAGRGEALTNIVLMGMGEPLHNYEQTVAAVRIMIDDRGLGFGKRRVTLSTVGLAPAIRRLADEQLGTKLALSLHATTDEQRQALIPMARKYPLREVLDACHYYCRRQTHRDARVTFEYVLLRGVNDLPDDAHRLVRIASHLPSKVNLIPWNPYPGARWERPEETRIGRFAELLQSSGIQVNTRISRGQEILAACGQLAVGPARPE
ncbi:MAG: 23S rRNA (adenine(2503)-C(2))-methyltransferase RlmN [Deltaproteobacteria bacterium]|nr:23S rRNA (adenine(2503)-C(2))-methyltransferase RlmN [Deltaproteobacteria bacterium]